jgi:hypothetical protein
MYVSITAMNMATDNRSWLLACTYLTRQYFTTRLNLSFFCFMLPYLKTINNHPLPPVP